MFWQYGELPPTNGWDRLGSLGHTSKFQRVLRLGFVTERRSTKLCTMSGRLLAGTLYIHFGGFLPHNGILPGAKFTLRGSPYRQRYCTALKQWATAEICGVVQGMELRNCRLSSFSTEGATYIPKAAVTLGICPHSSFLLLVSSPNLSGRRLNVYHTLTHDVALVRI